MDKIYLKDNGYLCVKGIDSCIIKVKQNKPLYSINGHLSHMAPEMAICKGYSYEADIWSLGVCIVEMLTGSSPFASINIKSTMENILLNESMFIHNLPEFINKIFIKNPKNRMTINELKND